ncbi:MAG TPA: GTPase Era [Spirochaetota bacterium]|nr:GTPase Era [Spirochaetota bacterium]
MNKKSGFVSLIGRPSSGKSTLINRICGYKVSIVSKHPQTTRFLIKGIYNDKESQLVFVDTPGVHNFNLNLNRGLSTLAIKNLEGGDIVLYLVDTTREFGDEEKEIVENLKQYQDKLIIAYNKLDSERKTSIKDEISKILTPIDSVDISALNGKNVTQLINCIKNHTNFGDLYYPEDYVTDQSIPFRISEMVREQVFNNTTDELPHSVYVEVNELSVNEELITARATIYVERDSQKGIVIGKGGTMIKKIGERARQILGNIFDQRINLFLDVKVNENWRKKDSFIKKMFDLS